MTMPVIEHHGACGYLLAERPCPNPPVQTLAYFNPSVGGCYDGERAVCGLHLREHVSEHLLGRARAGARP